MGCRGSLGTQGGLCKQGAVVTRKRNLFSRLLVGLPGNISWEQRLSGLRVFFFLIKKEEKKFEKQQSSSFYRPSGETEKQRKQTALPQCCAGTCQVCDAVPVSPSQPLSPSLQFTEGNGPKH